MIGTRTRGSSCPVPYSSDKFKMPFKLPSMVTQKDAIIQNPTKKWGFRMVKIHIYKLTLVWYLQVTIL